MAASATMEARQAATEKLNAKVAAFQEHCTEHNVTSPNKAVPEQFFSKIDLPLRATKARVATAAAATLPGAKAAALADFWARDAERFVRPFPGQCMEPL